MKIDKPAETVEVCDRCHRDGYLETCRVCGGRYCLCCEGKIACSWGYLNICRKCAGRDDVANVAKEYAARLTVIFKARTKALTALPKKLAEKEK